MNTRTRKVGRTTVALGLVALGFALLLDNLSASGLVYTSLLLRFWPALLIGFGAEYLLFSLLDREVNGQPVRLRFDFGGGFLLALLFALTAGWGVLSNWISLNPHDYVVDGGGRRESISVPVDGASEVAIEVDIGRVEIFSHGLNEVRVEASYETNGVLVLRDRVSALDQFRLTAEGGERIQVRGQAPASGANNISAAYRIYIPANQRVTVQTGYGSILVEGYDGDLNLKSRVGTITARGSAGTLDIESNSGSLVVQQHSGPVIARTNVGRITIHQVAGSIQADSGTGSIEVRDFTGGKLVAETRTGSLNVSTAAPLEGDLSLRTSTGSITLDLPQESSMKLAAQTKTGSISAPPFVSINKSGSSQSAVGSLGDGKYIVTLEASLGSIQLNTR